MVRNTNNEVTGPTSAMTDYIRSVGITPTTIARRAATRPEQPEAGPSNAANTYVVEDEQQTPAESSTSERRRPPRREVDNDAEYNSDALDEPASPAKKRKLTKAQEAKLKVKEKKAKEKKAKENRSEDEDAYTALSKSAWSNGVSSKPPVGGFENCAKCGKKFTVTKYTMAADPDPGFLCHSCSKAAGMNPFKKPIPKKRAPVNKRNVVHFEERRFPSLVSMCIDVISKNLDDIEAFGDIGALNMQAISKAISKTRRLTPENAHLFYGPENTTLRLYDATKLTPNAFISMGHLNPNLTSLRLDFCGLINNDVMMSWTNSFPQLRSIQLFGPFLVRKEAWIAFFSAHKDLEAFLITQSPRFDVECLDSLLQNSENTLCRLGLREIGKLNDEFLENLGKSSVKLTYLDIAEPTESCSDGALSDLLCNFGSSLTYLDVSNHILLTDDLLPQVAKYATSLETLIFSYLPELTDDGVARFFSSWKTSSPLITIDMSRNPDLSSNALLALLYHSGEGLQFLNINGWKDTSFEALAHIAKLARYIKSLDVGWCRSMDDFIVKDILDNSNLQELKVWGCNHVEGKWSVAATRKPASVNGIETRSSYAL